MLCRSFGEIKHIYSLVCGDVKTSLWFRLFLSLIACHESGAETPPTVDASQKDFKRATRQGRCLDGDARSPAMNGPRQHSSPGCS